MRKITLQNIGDWKEMLATVKSIAIPKHLTVNQSSLEFLFESLTNEQELAIMALESPESEVVAFKNIIIEKLKETDYLMLPDVPISSSCRDNFIAYRAALRNLEFGEELPNRPDIEEATPSLWKRLFG